MVVGNLFVNLRYDLLKDLDHCTKFKFDVNTWYKSSSLHTDLIVTCPFKLKQSCKYLIEHNGLCSFNFWNQL